MGMVGGPKKNDLVPTDYAGENFNDGASNFASWLTSQGYTPRVNKKGKANYTEWASPSGKKGKYGKTHKSIYALYKDHWKTFGVDLQSQYMQNNAGIRFSPEHTDFSTWLTTQGYLPTLKRKSAKLDMNQWDNPGKVKQNGGRYHPTNINQIYKKEGRAWQADIQAQTLAAQNGLDLNSFGVPTDPNLTTTESKLGNLQLMINEQEKQAALADRQMAIDQIMSQFQDPSFLALYDQTMNRFDNPDPLGAQYYDQLRAQGKEQNARALNDQILQIQNGLAGRGLGNSGISQGLQSRARVATSQSNLANNRGIGLQQAQNYTTGLDTAYAQGQGVLDRINNADTQIASLFGGTQYQPTDLSGLSASLNTKLRGYQSGRGFFG